MLVSCVRCNCPLAVVALAYLPDVDSDSNSEQ